MDLGVGVSGLASLQHYEKVPNTCVSLSDFPVVMGGQQGAPTGMGTEEAGLCDVGDAG